MFFNTLSAVGKYPVKYCNKLQHPIQIQVSEKRKTFSQFYVQFLETTLHFIHFEKKDDGHS